MVSMWKDWKMFMLCASKSKITLATANFVIHDHWHMVAELVYSLALCKSKLFYECLIDDGMMKCMYIAGLSPPPDISTTKLNSWFFMMDEFIKVIIQ